MMMDNYMFGWHEEELLDLTQDELFSLDFVKRIRLSNFLSKGTHVAVVDSNEVTGFIEVNEFFTAMLSAEKDNEEWKDASLKDYINEFNATGFSGSEALYPLERWGSQQKFIFDEPVTIEYVSKKCSMWEIWRAQNLDPDGARPPAFDLALVRIHNCSARLITHFAYDGTYETLESIYTTWFTRSLCKLRQIDYKEAPTIGINASLVDRLMEVKISLAKEVLMQSPLVKRGCVFHFNKKSGALICDSPTKFTGHLSKAKAEQSFFIMPEKWGFRIMWTFRGMGATGLNITWDDLPDIINSKSINKLVSLDDFVDAGLETEGNGNSHMFSLHGITIDGFKVGRTIDIDIHKSNETDSLITEVQWGDAYARCINAFKLLAAYSDPSLRGEMKVIEAKNTRKSGKGRKKKSPSIKRWVWGEPRVRYISSSATGNTRSRHYVRPHFATHYIKDIQKCADYNPVPSTLRPSYHTVVKWRKGAWKGRGEKFDITPEYNSVKRARHYSQIALSWLNQIEQERGIKIRHAEQGGEMRIDYGDGYYLVDGFHKESNTVYEFHGDVWHGNPELFADDYCPHPHRKQVTAKQLYEETMQKKEVIEALGFNYKCIWENDFRK